MSEQPWRCCSMHDPDGRRGVWFKVLPDGSLHVRAGREGDDASCTVPQPLGNRLKECLEWGAWMQEDYGPGLFGGNDHLDFTKDNV